MRTVLVIMLILASGVFVACGNSGNSGGGPDAASTNASGSSSSASDSTETPGGQVSNPKHWSSPPAMQLEEGKDYQAILHTNKGDMTVDLLESDAPKTVNNFVFLAKQGYYTNVPFHRIIKGFMIQTGDPTGTGAGGPGYRFADEPVTRDYVRGTVAMANAGPNTNGSQFFIMHQDNPLPKNYTIFGELIDGFDTLDAIANAPVGPSRSGEMSTPKEPLTLESVEIVTK